MCQILLESSHQKSQKSISLVAVKVLFFIVAKIDVLLTVKSKQVYHKYCS